MVWRGELAIFKPKSRTRVLRHANARVHIERQVLILVIFISGWMHSLEAIRAKSERRANFSHSFTADDQESDNQSDKMNSVL
jgi:hypothetical protein